MGSAVCLGGGQVPNIPDDSRWCRSDNVTVLEERCVCCRGIAARSVVPDGCRGPFTNEETAIAVAPIR